MLNGLFAKSSRWTFPKPAAAQSRGGATCSVQRDPSPGGASAEQRAATSAVVASLDRWSAADCILACCGAGICVNSPQTLGWTTVRPRHADAADGGTWLIASACWQLWLTRALVRGVRLAWGRRADGLLM